MKNNLVHVLATRSKRGVVVGGVVAVGMLTTLAAPAASANTATHGYQGGDGASYLLSANRNTVSTTSGSFGTVGRTATAQAVPEPGTWAMFGLGASLIGLGALMRRRRVRAELAY